MINQNLQKHDMTSWWELLPTLRVCVLYAWPSFDPIFVNFMRAFLMNKLSPLAT